MSENSATWANCRLDLPLPLPPLLPPLPSTKGTSSSTAMANTTTTPVLPKPRKGRLLHRFTTLIAALKSHHHNFVHPAYQQLARKASKAEKDAETLPKTSPAKQKRARFGVCQLAVRIKHRVLHYSPLARVPPFYCHKCGLASNKLQVLVNHVCSRKLAAFSEYTNLEKLVRLGFRSKVKDAFAVLERIPNPQSVKINRLASSLHFHLWDKLRSPSTLMEIASKAFESAHLHFETVVPVWSPPSSNSQDPETGELIDQLAYSQDTTGYFCQACSRLFCRFLDYDQHLDGGGNEDCAKLPDPLEIEVATNRPYPKFGHLVNNKEEVENTENQTSTQPQNLYSCTKCLKRDFLSMEHFHGHIFDCALQDM